MNARANIFMADPNDSKLQRFNCFRAVFGPHVERWECLCPIKALLSVALNASVSFCSIIIASQDTILLAFISSGSFVCVSRSRDVFIDPSA